MKTAWILALVLTLACTAATAQGPDWVADDSENIQLDAGGYHTGRVYRFLEAADTSIRVDLDARLPVTVSMTWIWQWNRATRYPGSEVPDYRCVQQHVLNTTYTCELPAGGPMVLVVRDERAGTPGTLEAPNDVHIQYYNCRNCLQPQFQWVSEVKDKYEITPAMKVYSSFTTPDHDGEQISIKIKSPIALDLVVLSWRQADQLYEKPETLEAALASTSCKLRGVRDTTFGCVVNMAEGPQSLVLVPEPRSSIAPHKKAEVEVQDVKCTAYCDIAAPRSNTQMETDIQNSLYADLKTRPERITARSDKGIVTLSGNVTSDAARNAAAADAAQVDGVKTVVNNLQVAPVPVLALEANPASAANSDSQIAADVKDAIDADAGISYEQITVNCNDRVVTLSGSVASEAARSAAAGDAAHVTGVKIVINNLQVTSSPAAPNAADAAAQPANVAEPPDPGSASNNPPAQSNIPPAAPEPITIPAGTNLAVHMYDQVSSQTAHVGDVFRGGLVYPVMVNGALAIPATAEVEGRVVDVKQAKSFGRPGTLNLQLTTVTIDGAKYALDTASWSRAGSAQGVKTGVEVASGTTGGAVIGDGVGGAKGAGIGAGVGAGLGIAIAALTKGEPIVIMPEAVISFTTRSPFAVNPAGENGRPVLRHQQQ